MQEVQANLPCLRCLEKIDNLEKFRGEIKAENADQWKEINALKVLVYMGAGAAGALSFAGSLIGSFLKQGLK